MLHRAEQELEWAYEVAAAGAWMEEAARRNPAFSESYRPAGLPRPNGTVLEAQGRVCTGPEPPRPLGEEQAMRVLDTILRSGEPPPTLRRLRFR